MRNILIFVTFFMSFAGMALAESPLDPRRAIVHRDTDFPGGDIQSIFDTTREACETACFTRQGCAAYTYNSKSAACFLKSEMGETSDFTGAFSAEVIDRPAALLDRAEAQAARLDFLHESDIAAAETRARALPHDFPVGGWSAGALTEFAREAEGNANLAAAMRYMAGATVISDAAGDWIDYARLSNAAARATEDTGDARKYFDQALDAAISGFLRSESGPQEANALIEMATALENTDRGRASIPALRLAQAASPRDDTQGALDRALGLYGFRVTDTQVDSDAASPRICAVFSEDLVSAGVDYAPFVSSETSGLAVSAKDRQLCIEGITHGERYSFTLRPGLPAATGEVLAKPVQLSQYVRDRAPSVHFPGRAYVLPPTADAGLPVVVVNTSALDLTLSRLPDGNLVRAFDEDWFGRSLTQWDESWFNETLAETVWEGTAEVATELNRDVTTRLPIGEAIDEMAPGVYVLHASIEGQDQDTSPPASQWFVISDIGLTTMT
ncbi:MAG: alpha-2-macroglobulin family protein, partial [Maritimibacter sp.]|nr:alpha-2-macroglobulin family protein [Maritimibacter sp.]